MKKLLIAAALTATLSAPALAEEDVCVSIYKLAERAMEVRQDGFAMTEVIGKLSEQFAKDIVIDAYSEPSYSTAEYKNKTIKEFANKYALACYKSN